MRLVDLNPHWVNDHDAPPDAKQGISFWCPHCVGTPKATRLAVFFDPPITDHPPADVSLANALRRADAEHLTDHHIGHVLWKRAGDTFEALTMTPSIDCSAWGCWHGFITNGEIR